MKLLLTGKNGQVGFELQRSLAILGQVIAVDQEDCNLAQGASVARLVQQVQPDIIVNAAAATAVDQLETNPDLAFAVNATATGILAQEAAKTGALVVHYSTDYVFDGSQQSPYRETDATNPLNTYGQSKLKGELLLAQATSRFLILRTSWVVGAHGANFAKTILRLAATRDHLRIVSDQIGVPTSATLLADLTALLVQRYQLTGPSSFPFGIYHVAPSGETNWYDYARLVISEALAKNQPLKVQPQDVVPITSAEYPTPARRPANSRLDTQLFRKTFSLHLPPWQDGVRRELRHMLGTND
ncbi:MAG: dTDP-4-dehydrorhamnose reductase [Magnetococcales bacterium]|nr:dTDP-4-dehydrorhamnose reductase [Magnetococcales bacterium]